MRNTVVKQNDDILDRIFSGERLTRVKKFVDVTTNCIEEVENC